LAEQKRYTIGEIRDQANKLLGAYGSVGTVKVETAKGVYDIPIDIPEVDRVPVLKVTFPSTDQVPSAPENGELSIKMCDYEEAADALGISRQAVGSRLNRARRKLRFALEGSDDHEPA
jgi:hypothetical protein